MSNVQITNECGKDAEKEQRIRVWLGQQGGRSLGRLDVKVIGESVVIGGSVGSFYEKQLATSCCQRVAGILHVHNQVEVEDVGSPAVSAGR